MKPIFLCLCLCLCLCYFFVFFIGCGQQNDHSCIKTWNNGIVPYYFDYNINTFDIMMIERCFDEIEKKTKCINFIRTDSLLSLKISYSDIGYSAATVGINKCNEMKLTTPLRKRIVFHEILHVLGMRHEHQRADRNNYIKILYQNIYSEYQKYFDIVNQTYDIDKFEYDTKSIMHYDSISFSKSGTQSIIFLNNDYEYSSEPTDLDYQKLISIYQVP